MSTRTDESHKPIVAGIVIVPHMLFVIVIVVIV